MLFSIMEMFISFFTGKVMLFYGITLIMKEKSNASALQAKKKSATRGRDSCYSRPRVALLAAAVRATRGRE